MLRWQSPQQEAAEDIFFGQLVTIWARWFVILTGALLTLWSATSASAMVGATLLIVVLMGLNFFMHGRYLMDQPANQTLLLVVSLFDLLLITLVVWLWREPMAVPSPFFIFYYPVVLAFALVFPHRATAIYTLITLLLYTGVYFLTAPTAVDTVSEVKVLVARLITLAAMGGLGAYYWRLQRQWRRAALAPQNGGQAG